jgi:septal ring factor EnvC (AmiA/AmiB activator)
MRVRFIFLVILVAVTSIVGGVFWYSGTVSASVVDDLKERISERNTQVRDLEREVERYRQQVAEIGQQARTLATALAEIEANGRRLEADARLTQARIEGVTLNIERLEIEITEMEMRIARNIESITEIIRTMDQMEASSMLMNLLSYNSFSDFPE